MDNSPLHLIEQFFVAYSSHDMAALRDIVTSDITWTFPGRNPFSGVHTGLDSVVAFFDSMGAVMGGSNPAVEKLITSANDDYVVEAQHIVANRPDGPNLDHYWCVLWRFENGKIAAGQHLASDQYAADAFFNAIASASH